tara:strand:+ start:1434 stop:2096 length:663 start_codon:yes stop_codon:yes gene_type:complete
MKNIVLLGAPATGKGTIANKLTEIGYTQVSASDLLREEIKNKENKYYKEAKYSLDEGKLISNEIICSMMENKIEKMKGKPVVFDGFARTVEQAELIKEALNDKFLSVYLKYDNKNVLIDRVSSRLTCKDCATTFSDKTVSSSSNCSDCNGSLYRRKDDNPETMDRRLKEFEDNTLPAIKWLKDNTKKSNFLEFTIEKNSLQKMLKKIKKKVINKSRQQKI